MPSLPSIPMHENELARRDPSAGAAGPAALALQLRPQPLRARWVIDGLITADRNDLRCTFSCSVRALADPTERRMLTEVLMGPRRSVTDADVVAHFAPTLRNAAAEQAGLKGVEVWLSPEGKPPLVAALKKAAEAVAFACGVEVLAPFEVELQSPSHEQQRLREMQRKLAEQEAAGHVEQLARAGELLKKFQEIRQNAPELSASRVLEQISPTDRGSMLQTLLLASARQEAGMDLWAVAGPYLVKVEKIDAAATPGGAPKMSLTPLPPTLGPLRSVQPAMIDGRRVLLVGARSGVLLVRPGEHGEPTAYGDATIDSPLGFSRVLFQPAHGDMPASLVGCHGDAGIVRWDLGNTAAPSGVVRRDQLPFDAMSSSAGVLPPPLPSVSGVSLVGGRLAGPRNLQLLDDARLIFSVGSEVWVLDGADLSEVTPGTQAEVIAIIPDAGQMQIVHEDGTIRTLDRVSRQITATQRQGIRLRAAGSLPWLGGTRLLLAGDEGPVQCMGADDPLVTHYASAHRGLRVLCGSADRVAAISADRQRLVVWNSWDGRQPVAEAYVTALTRHRLADVEFG
jgi:hypothetical protein